MELLKCKARLSVMWVVMALGSVAAMFLGMMSPGIIEKIMAGEWGGMDISEASLVIYAILFLIPMLLAILSLTMDNLRWLNFIFGILWILLFIYQFVFHATVEEAVPICTWLMLAAGFIVSVFIVYFAWKLPQEQA